jgi:hypothetical protein
MVMASVNCEICDKCGNYKSYSSSSGWSDVKMCKCNDSSFDVVEIKKVGDMEVTTKFKSYQEYIKYKERIGDIDEIMIDMECK